MHVIDERHAGAPGGEPAHECRPRRVGMDDVVAVALHQLGNSLDDSEVEPAVHRHFHERRLLALSGRGEPPRLHAREAHLAAESRQLPGEQVLHALGTGVVLAVHQVQDLNRFNAARCDSLGGIEVVRIDSWCDGQRQQGRAIKR